MMGHNIRFKEEIWKIIPKLSLFGALDMIIITWGGGGVEIKTEAATNMLYEMTTNLVSKHIMMALLV